MTTSSFQTVNIQDRALLSALRKNGRSSIAHLARLVGLARGTVHSRLDRLENSGVITGYGPNLDANKLGFTVQAYVTLETDQSQYDDTLNQLIATPQVLEVHTITGSGDLLCKVIAQSNQHLNELIQTICKSKSVLKTQTSISLSTPLERTLSDVLDQL